MRGVRLKPGRSRSLNSKGGGAWFPWWVEIPLIIAVGQAAVWWYSWKH